MSLPTPPSSLTPGEPLLEIPSRYSATMLWQEESTQILQSLQYTGDSTEGVINVLKSCKTKVWPNHKHYARAINFVKGFHIPTSTEEFEKDFQPQEWDIVGERILLLYHMHKLQKLSSFHLFLVSIYCHEYGVEICTWCGLTLGPWCGKCFYWLVWIPLIDLSIDDDSSDSAWGSPILEATEWGAPPEGSSGEDWVDLAVSGTQGANSLL